MQLLFFLGCATFLLRSGSSLTHRRSWRSEFSLCVDEDSARTVFRTLALIVHPDKCGDTPECADGFIALREAYAVRVAELTGTGAGSEKLPAADENWLTAFKARCKGRGWRDVQGGAAGGWLAWRVGLSGAVPLTATPSTSATITLTPREALTNHRTPLNVTATRRCPACEGRGWSVDASAPTCGKCAGRGWSTGAAFVGGAGAGAGETATLHTCAACCGTGGATHACPLCHGAGTESRILTGSLRVRGMTTSVRTIEAWEPVDAGAGAEPSLPPPWVAEPDRGWALSPPTVAISFSWNEFKGVGAPRIECGGGSYCGGPPHYPRIALAHPHIQIDARVGVFRWCGAAAVVVPLVEGGAVRVVLPTRPRTLPLDGIWTAVLHGRGFPIAALDANATSSITIEATNTEATTTTPADIRGDIRVSIRLLFPARLNADDFALLEECLTPGDVNEGESDDPMTQIRDASELVAALAAAYGSEPGDDAPRHAQCDARDTLITRTVMPFIF